MWSGHTWPVFVAGLMLLNTWWTEAWSVLTVSLSKYIAKVRMFTDTNTRLHRLQWHDGASHSHVRWGIYPTGSCARRNCICECESKAVRSYPSGFSIRHSDAYHTALPYMTVHLFCSDAFADRRVTLDKKVKGMKGYRHNTVDTHRM